MKLLNRARIGPVVLILVGLFSSGWAQTTTDTSDGASALTGLTQKNVQGVSMAARAPGKMVNAGIAKLQDVSDPPPASVTETDEPGPFDLFRLGLVDAFFEVLQTILTAFTDLLFEHWGLVLIDSNTNGNDNNNSNTNDNINDNGNINNNGNANLNANQNDNRGGRKSRR